MRRSTSRCSAQSRTTSPAGRHNCGIGSSSQLATVIGAMNAGAGPTCSAYARWNQPELGAEAIGPLEVVPGTPQKYPATAIPRGRSLELRERRAGTSLGPSRTPSRRRPPRPTAQAVPGDEDRQCVGPIGSQSARQTPQPFVQLSEPTSDAVRTWSASPDQLSDDAGRRSRTSANDRVLVYVATSFPRFEPTDGEPHV